jgi:putative phage-type endonuclease
MLTQDQIEERKTGLFATDAAPALGMSKYRTPVDVWLEKTGQSEPANIGHIEAVQMGNFMEPVIARLYTERLGVKLDPLPISLRHPKHSFMGSHFDYLAPGKKLVEIKNFHSMRRKDFGENGSTEVPMDVLIQCIHEATVYGTEEIDVAVLFGGQEFCVFPLTIDKDASDRLIQMEEEFWRKFVVERAAPAPRTAEEARALFPKDDGDAVVATIDVLNDHADLARVKQSIKELEQIEDSLKARIQTYMAHSGTLLSPDGVTLATWKKAKDGARFNAKAFEADYPALYAQYMEPVVGARRFLPKA